MVLKVGVDDLVTLFRLCLNFEKPSVLAEAGFGVKISSDCVINVRVGALICELEQRPFTTINIDTRCAPFH